MLDGVLGLSWAAGEAALAIRLASALGRILRSPILLASAFSVKQPFWRECDKSRVRDRVPESSNALFPFCLSLCSPLVDRRRSPVLETLVQALMIVEPEVTFDAGPRFRHRRVVLQVTSSYLSERHRRSTKMLSMQRPARPC